MTFPANIRGAFWMLGAALSFTGVLVAVRILSASMPTTEIILFRSAFAAALTLPWLMRSGRAGALRTTRLHLHGIIGLVVLAAMMCWFFGIARVPLADSAALQFAQPLFTVIAAAAILGEKVDARRWIAIGVGFAGAMTIIRPGFAAISAPMLLVLASAALFAASNILTKILLRTDGADLIVFYTNLLPLPLVLMAVPFAWWTPDIDSIPWIALLGVSGTTALTCLTRAFAAADASVVMPFDFFRLIFGASAGMIVFGEALDLWTLAGALLIFGGTLYVIRREARLARAGARAG